MFHKKNRPKNQESRETVESILKKQEVEKLTLKARALVKDHVYPSLLTHSKNIEHAKILCSHFGTILQIAFGELSKKMKLADLMKEYPLNEKDESYPFLKEMLDLLQDEDVSFAQTVVSSFGPEIERLVRKESHERKLDTLKVDFYEDNER